MRRALVLLLASIGAFSVIAFGALLIVSSVHHKPTTTRIEPANSGRVAAGPTSSAPAIAASAPKRPLTSVSAASFTADQLVICVDLSSAMPAAVLESFRLHPETVTSARVVAEKLGPDGLLTEELRVLLLDGETLVGESLKKKGLKGALLPGIKDVQPLHRACAEQFPGRTVIGSCKVALPYDGHLEFRIFKALGADRAMKQCLSIGGDWSEVPRDSLEFHHARNVEMYEKAAGEISPP